MDTTLTYACPNCGAGLTFVPDKQKFCCEFCLSEFSEAELDSEGAQEKAEEAAKKNAEFCEAMHEYHCPNCGADIITDESAPDQAV